MFDLIKKLRAKKEAEKAEEEKKEKEQSVLHKQKGKDNLYRGMYCPACGYMSVNTDSNELPLEGFALCPNCGEHLKTGWFLKSGNGFSLTDKADQLAAGLNRVSGGHYRVRKAGPARSLTRGHFSN
jgi:ssDNA-binding Zn-finger/Zn-ribbon topoisomerase 1